MTAWKQRTSARVTRAFSSFCVTVMTSQTLPQLPAIPGTMEADTETVSTMLHCISPACAQQSAQQCVHVAAPGPDQKHIQEQYMFLHNKLEVILGP